jgi:hypothetical protein
MTLQLIMCWMKLEFKTTTKNAYPKIEEFQFENTF